MRRLALICCIAFNSLIVPAQIDSILSLSPSHQIHALWTTYYYGHEQELARDSAFISLYNALEQKCKAADNNLLAQQVWLMRNIARGNNLYGAIPLGVSILEGATREALHNGWDVIAAECVLYTGLVYYTQQKYGPAFEHLLRGYKLLQEFGFEKHPHTIRHVANLAYAYYPFEDYGKAIGYLKQTLTIPSPWNKDGFHRQTYNTIGLCYQRMMQYDSAIHFYQLAHEASVVAGDSFWAALSNGNKGHAYVLSGRHDEALPLLKKDHEQSIISNETGSALTSALELASIHILRGQRDTAEHYLDFVHRHINPKDYRSMSRYYYTLYALQKLRGDDRQAVVYADSFHIFRDSVALQEASHVDKRIKEKVEVEQYASEIRMLEAARNRQILLRNALVAIVLLSGCIVVLWINRQRLKRRKELEMHRIQQQVAEDEINRAKSELLAFTETLRQRNEIIESVQTELDQLRNTMTADDGSRTQHIGALLNATILTEDDWKQFRKIFDKVHPAFFGSLKEKYPDLTPADLRLLALTKLKLAPREMMSMLGVTYDAIKKSRKRLMTRLDLPGEENLVDFVESLSST